MNQANLPLNRILAFGIFLVALSLLRTGVAMTQSVRPGYTRDNSDWWSYTGRPEGDDKAISQNRELSASNFQILGLELNDETLDRAMRKLGKTTVVQRGDASTGRSQICYSSPGKEPKTYLIFEKGEVNDALYLFTGGPDWNASDRCTDLNLIAETLSTRSGLHLGQTRAQVRIILGKPSLVSG